MLMKKFYFAITALLMVLILPGCKKGNGDDTRTVKYSIQCADCYVICYDENGDEKTWEHQNSSWTYSFEGESGDVLLLFAYNTSNNPAMVGGKVEVDGTVTDEETSYCPVSGNIFVVDTLNF